uniref:Transmembrane protein n=1 Tax=Heterorhabditis bacteriophora TaxID=37862 RepID=A0A1I7WD82_HETBA
MSLFLNSSIPSAVSLWSFVSFYYSSGFSTILPSTKPVGYLSFSFFTYPDLVSSLLRIQYPRLPSLSADTRSFKPRSIILVWLLSNIVRDRKRVSLKISLGLFSDLFFVWPTFKMLWTTHDFTIRCRVSVVKNQSVFDEECIRRESTMTDCSSWCPPKPGSMLHHLMTSLFIDNTADRQRSDYTLTDRVSSWPHQVTICLCYSSFYTYVRSAYTLPQFGQLNKLMTMMRQFVSRCIHIVLYETTNADEVSVYEFQERIPLENCSVMQWLMEVPTTVIANSWQAPSFRSPSRLGELVSFTNLRLLQIRLLSHLLSCHSHLSVCMCAYMCVFVFVKDMHFLNNSLVITVRVLLCVFLVIGLVASFLYLSSDRLVMTLFFFYRCPMHHCLMFVLVVCRFLLLLVVTHRLLRFAFCLAARKTPSVNLSVSLLLPVQSRPCTLIFHPIDHSLLTPIVNRFDFGFSLLSLSIAPLYSFVNHRNCNYESLAASVISLLIETRLVALQIHSHYQFAISTNCELCMCFRNTKIARYVSFLFSCITFIHISFEHSVGHNIRSVVNDDITAVLIVYLFSGDLTVCCSR